MEDNENRTNNNIKMSANIREDMVEMAVRFLTNPTVSTSSKFTKKQFLSKKGLSVEEIAAAFSMMQQHPLGRNSIHLKHHKNPLKTLHCTKKSRDQ